MSERTVALFCGSRSYYDYERIRDDLAALPEDAVVIEGGAEGADRTARNYALARGLHVATMPALWNEYGRSAGPRRNKMMLALQPTIVYAYPSGDSRGTRGMIRLAKDAGIPVVVFEVTP